MKENLKVYRHKEPVALESGAVLPEVEIAYHTYGRLNDDKSNVVWVCHALTGDSDVADWWPNTVARGKFLAPDRFFVVCANVLGSCYGTTGPLSVNPETGEKWYDDFPEVTVRDMVLCHRLLARHLGIDHAYALIGSSLGGYQALEWLVTDPDFARRGILIATGSHTRPWQAAFNETMRMAIEADSSYGNPYDDAGTQGMGVARAIGLLSYRGRIAYDATQPDVEPRTEIFRRRVHTYQRHQAQKLMERFNAYSYHRLCSAVDSHDVGRLRESRACALAAVRARCLVIAISTDIMFPPCDHRDMVELIPDAEFHILDSEFAHDGFLVEHEKLDVLIEAFYNETEKRNN